MNPDLWYLKMIVFLCNACANTLQLTIQGYLQERPQLPEGTKVLTIPTIELTNIEGTDGDSAMNQQVVRKSKKQWVLNPNGKTMVSKTFGSRLVGGQQW